jgi:hypothetical protein
VGHDILGQALTTDKKNEVMAALALTREINFNFHAKDPTFTQIDVKAVVVAEDGVDKVALAANIEQSIASGANPLVWGGSSNPQDSGSWRNETIARRGVFYTMVTRVPGVRYIDETTTPLQIRANGGAWVTTDITLSGLAPLVTSDIADMDITVL